MQRVRVRGFNFIHKSFLDPLILGKSRGQLFKLEQMKIKSPESGKIMEENSFFSGK